MPYVVNPRSEEKNPESRFMLAHFMNLSESKEPDSLSRYGRYTAVTALVWPTRRLLEAIIPNVLWVKGVRGGKLTRWLAALAKRIPRFTNPGGRYEY